MIHGKPRRLYIIGDDMERLGAKENCYMAAFPILQRKGVTMLAREGNPRFRKIMKHFSDPLIIYSKWTGYLEGKHADPKIKEFIHYVNKKIPLNKSRSDSRDIFRYQLFPIITDTNLLMNSDFPIDFPFLSYSMVH